MKSRNINGTVFSRRAALALLLLLCQGAVHAQGTWQSLSADLYGVGMRDENTFVAVGEFGKIMVGADGGRSWSLRDAPVRDVLTSVAFGDGNTGIIVGYHGVILRTANGGDTWARVADSGTVSLTRVRAVSPTEYFAVGSLGKVLRSTDGGSHWSVIPTPTGAILFDIAFKSSRSAIIVGDSGTTLLSEDGGASWGKGQIPDPVTLFSCAFNDSLHGIVVGRSGVIDVTTDGGQSWSPAVTTSDIDQLRDICYVTKDVVIACGFSRGASKLIRSTDGGRTWTYDEPSGLQKYAGIMGVARDDQGDALAVGLDNLILWTSDRALSWQTISSMPTSTTGAPATVHIQQIGQADSLHLFATGSHGWFYRSVDGGVTWISMKLPTTSDMTGLIVSSQDTIIAESASEYFYTSTDGGRSWSQARCSVTPNLPGFRLGRCLMVTDSIGSMSYGDSQILSELYVFRTTDRGTSWRGSSLGTWLPHMFPLETSFPTPEIGFVTVLGIDSSDVDFPAVFKSIDSGKNWTRQNIPVTSGLTGIDFRTPLLGVACGDSGVIIRTTDGGEHWSPVHFNAMMKLSGIRLINDTVGYAVGDQGVVVETKDGGRTWHESDIWSFGPRDTTLALSFVYCQDGSHVYAVGPNVILANWLGAQNTSAGTAEKDSRLPAKQVTIEVIPNPIVGQIAIIKVRGRPTQSTILDVCDIQGHIVVQLKALSVDAAGDQIYLWNTAGVPKGTYFVGPHGGSMTAGVTIHVE